VFVLLGYRHQRGYGVAQSDEAAAYWFHEGAVRDDKTSMVALGLRYANGRGVPQDYLAAVYWWRRANGTPLASRFLGDALACGLGIDRNPAQAMREYTKAADAGEMSSSIQLARIYLGGCAAAPHVEVAFKHFSRAASAGDPDAQIALSELLLEGQGGEADTSEAYRWARIAERRLPAGELRTQASEKAKTAAARMTKDAVATADRLVDALIAR
jgi:uncharacterized protein